MDSGFGFKPPFPCKNTTTLYSFHYTNGKDHPDHYKPMEMVVNAIALSYALQGMSSYEKKITLHTKIHLVHTNIIPLIHALPTPWETHILKGL